MSFLWRIVFFILIERGIRASVSTTTLPSNEQSGSSLLDVTQKKVDVEHTILDESKTSKENSSVYNEGQLGFNERKRDEKRYGEQDAVRKGHDKGRHSSEKSEVVDHSRNSFERHGGGYYKKGHHRTGFSNNYHKDESGNNSSFYEDSDDEGGHRSSKNSGGYYGQKSQNSFNDGLHDASYVERDRTQEGILDNRQTINNYHDHLGEYNNNRYKDDKRNYLKDETGRYFDKNREEIYYKGKHHPIIYRNNDRVPSSGYLRYHVDMLPKEYYKEDPYIVTYSNDYRYFPYRLRDYERELYYPYRNRYNRHYRSDFYDNEYLNRYRKGFD